MKVRVRAKLKPMTRDQFATWQKQQPERQAERQADCDACSQVHRVLSQDYFLDG